MLQQLKKENFSAEILENSGVKVVDFFAEWCMPCQMMHPILEEVEREYPNVRFYAVNIDEQAELASTYGIQSVPTVIFFRNGQMVDQKVGLLPKETLSQAITALLPNTL